MKKIGCVLVVCFVVGMYGCSQNDAGTNNNGATTVQKDKKDSLLNAASKLNAPDKTNEGAIKDTAGAVKDSTPQSH